MKSILITGGARSGKSRIAAELAAKAGGKVLFVATAEAGDDEMKRRIEAHRKARPKDWQTIEATTHIGGRIAENIGGAKTVIIDCVTLLVNNIFEEHGGKTVPAALEKAVTAEINELLECIKKTKADFIIVTNEVGLGIIPGDRVSRLYRDLLGKANQVLAQGVDEVYFMVAGIPVTVKKN
ncbi:MAG: bifunctional adenosylcobinamide kinase/adenosylcobinamide-phosphate guanylyltransferase [Dehalococcoidales bacterium]|nr:bifunctional adenosylcobinamide kinase/adenosylcobinamide-phosphate guanylyltransferase [Dehalococcoidales bacterium]